MEGGRGENPWSRPVLSAGAWVLSWDPVPLSFPNGCREKTKEKQPLEKEERYQADPKRPKQVLLRFCAASKPTVTD